ncbi:hypothetical protein QBC46DRAFT_272923, partial [Diplogelasinospora grovesii]
KLFSTFLVKKLFIGNITIFISALALYSGALNINAFIIRRAFTSIKGTGIYIRLLIILLVNTNDIKRLKYLSFIRF